MNAFYSILKISPNTILDDHLTLGIIIISPSDVWFKYEPELLRMIKPFCREGFPGIEKVLKMMRRKIHSLESHQLDLYNEVGPFFEKALYEKLALTQTGLIRFTAPVPIAIPTPTEEGYNNIAKAIIGDWTIVKNKIINSERKSIDQKLLQPLSEMMDTHMSLNSKQIDSLYFRYEIDAIGKGKYIYIVKYLDFRQTAPTLERKVMRLLFLMDSMETQYKMPIKTFVIGTIPSQRSRSKTYIYNLVNTQPNLQFIQTDDILQILKFLQAEGIQKLWVE